MDYFILKTIHILSSTILFGTGLGSAFYLWRANQTKNLQSMRFACKNVVIADWVFTTPAVIIQPLTGFWLMHILHYSITSRWIIWSLCLYGFVGLCWIPVVWIQIKMHQIIEKAAQHPHQKINPLYFRYERLWFYLGWPAFISVVGIFALMVFKPF